MLMKESDFHSIHMKKDNVEFDLDMKPWYDRFVTGQRWLEEQVVRDMEPYIPICTGNLREHIKQVNYANIGDEKIIAYSRPTTAYPREMYYGYNNNGKKMRFSKVAKENHYYEWVNGVRERIMGR